MLAVYRTRSREGRGKPATSGNSETGPGAGSSNDLNRENGRAPNGCGRSHERRVCPGRYFSSNCESLASALSPNGYRWPVTSPMARMMRVVQPFSIAFTAGASPSRPAFSYAFRY